MGLLDQIGGYVQQRVGRRFKAIVGDARRILMQIDKPGIVLPQMVIVEDIGNGLLFLRFDFDLPGDEGAEIMIIDHNGHGKFDKTTVTAVDHRFTGKHRRPPSGAVAVIAVAGQGGIHSRAGAKIRESARLGNRNTVLIDHHQRNHH